MSNLLDQFDLIFYRLKRQFGLPLIVRKPTGSANDIQTGKMVRSYDTCKIRRAIRLPAEVVRTMVHDVTLSSANKNFMYGGLFDKSTKLFIIDTKDLKVDGVKMMLDESCHIVCELLKYDITQLTLTENGSSYLIKAKNIDSSPIISDP